jgi:hypothetical protein
VNICGDFAGVRGFAGVRYDERGLRRIQNVREKIHKEAEEKRHFPSLTPATPFAGR